MRYITLTIIISIILAVNYDAFSQKQEVDLIVHNAKVYTVDEAFTKVSAFAIDKGKFIDRSVDGQTGHQRGSNG